MAVNAGASSVHRGIDSRIFVGPHDRGLLSPVRWECRQPGAGRRGDLLIVATASRSTGPSIAAMKTARTSLT